MCVQNQIALINLRASKLGAVGVIADPGVRHYIGESAEEVMTVYEDGSEIIHFSPKIFPVLESDIETGRFSLI